MNFLGRGPVIPRIMSAIRIRNLPGIYLLTFLVGIGGLAVEVGCGRSPLSGGPGQGPSETWIDDEGREISVRRGYSGADWVGTWVEAQYCPVEGSLRPPERFRLQVDEEGRGVGTIGVCRYGYADCANGPAVAEFEATVAVDRIDGTVSDPQCHDYSGTEVLRRVRCPRRPVTDYLESSVPLSWDEDYSRLDSAGVITYRAVGGDATTEVWAISSIRGVVTLLTSHIRVQASDGAIQYYSSAGVPLVALDEEVLVGSRLASLRFTQGFSYELALFGFTPALRPTDPHCVRGD